MRIFGLIGYPLTHSFSHNYFKEKFRREIITNTSYELFPISDIKEFSTLIATHPNLLGLNVTIPYKEQIIPFLTELEATAKIIGAVNCIKIKHSLSGQVSLKGFNTDAYGFSQSIKPFLKNHYRKALILGNGGASKAVEYALKKTGIETIKVSRNAKSKPYKADFLYSELTKEIIQSCQLIINTTPMGTFPDIHNYPQIPYEHLTTKHFLYDLVYNPEETEFLKRGKLNGAKTMNGINMLKLQADKSWKIFNLQD